MVLEDVDKKPVQNRCYELDEIKISQSKEIVPCFMYWGCTAMMDLQNCTSVGKDVLGPNGKAYPTSHEVYHAINIKTESSDAEEEEEPVPITFVEIKTEPEVS
jgi:hypothetical protein